MHLTIILPFFAFSMVGASQAPLPDCRGWTVKLSDTWDVGVSVYYMLPQSNLSEREGTGTISNPSQGAAFLVSFLSSKT